MDEERIEIAVSAERKVSAIRAFPETSPAGWTFVYAPGAGSNLNDPFGAYACRELTAKGFITLRFQFPYMEARSRRPDRTSVVESTWRSVISEARSAGPKLAVGGRSFGGRIASQVVAQGEAVDALALFAYPLRPPYSPSQWRDAHFPKINVPTLFCSGTRDAFATPEEIRSAASKVSMSKLHLLEGADHGFAALKSSGRTREEVWEEAVRVLAEWLDTLDS